MAFCVRPVARRAKLAEADERTLPAIGRLAPVGRAAERVEAGRVGIGVEAQILDLADTCGGQLRGDKAGQIELEVARFAGCEEAIGGGIVGQKGIAKTGIHLVAGLRDGRSDGGADPASLCAERKHLFHRIGKDAFLGAAPACMGGGDHARFPVRKQNGCAVRRHHAYQQAGGRSDQRVDSWPRIAFETFLALTDPVPS